MIHALELRNPQKNGRPPQPPNPLIGGECECECEFEYEYECKHIIKPPNLYGIIGGSS